MQEKSLQHEIASIVVAVPTVGRSQILIDTVTHLLRQSSAPAEILILDRSVDHTQSAQDAVLDWSQQGLIRWMRLPRPSIPAAMNEALLTSRSDVVLFIDDDVVPDDDLVLNHLKAHKRTGAAIVAGRVIQPWQRD